MSLVHAAQVDRGSTASTLRMHSAPPAVIRRGRLRRVVPARCPAGTVRSDQPRSGGGRIRPIATTSGHISQSCPAGGARGAETGARRAV